MKPVIYTVDGREFELQHYGIKGMKWGVRKARKAQAKFASKAERQAATHQSNASTIKRLLKSGYDEGDMPLDDETRRAYQHELRRAIASAEKWMKTRDDIMSMKLPDITANDVKDRFKDTYRKQGAGYYPGV